MAPLPGDFEGSPQDMAEAMVERMEIQSPVGTNFFVVGDIEPTSDQGPWLKNGDRWYVFSATDGKYVPINLEDSLDLFTIGATLPGQPGVNDPLLFIRTTGSRSLGWYGWDGSTWRPFSNVPPSGTTAERPSSPSDLEQFWDTDIDALIHYERGSWRTVSGVPGDIKHVSFSVLADALERNPGWVYLGKDDQSIRGLVIGIATKDAGATPDSVFATDSGISARASGDKVGEETHVLDSDEIEQHTHLIGHATLLNSDNDIHLHRVDDAETLAIPNPGPYNYFEVKGDGAANGTKTGTAGNGPAGTMLVTTKQLSKANASATNYTELAVAHNNMQPTVFFWTLVKT
ncbi:MAG: hypothetical protein HOO67_06080 [Candidatus Peribacteraceae bacterium]|nr:hypothetical protein [Candidatus Peribacteraceae bacterium]